ncbi:MAG: hypothetical protein JSV00_06980 [bacterium]|nr:MAG: hypothetical protein JSV00_06980 [bacterium]
MTLAAVLMALAVLLVLLGGGMAAHRIRVYRGSMRQIRARAMAGMMEVAREAEKGKGKPVGAADGPEEEGSKTGPQEVSGSSSNSGA